MILICEVNDFLFPLLVNKQFVDSNIGKWGWV